MEKIRPKQKKVFRPGKIAAAGVRYAFVLAMMAFTLYPVIYTLVGSFKTNAELTQGVSFFPSEWQLQNYYQAFVEADFLRYSVNSLIVSGSVMALAMLTSSLAGFAMARRNFAGKKLWLALYLSMMFVSLGSITLYPIYGIMRAFNLHKSLLGLILTMTGGQAANVFLIMGFIKSIPRQLDEAAIIDGCSVYQVYGRIILPLIKPILGVVALFSFRNTWNDYITGLIMTVGAPQLKTLTVAVVQLKYSVNAAAEWHIMLAGASIAIIPILLVYLLASRSFIAGLTAGAMKG